VRKRYELLLLALTLGVLPGVEPSFSAPITLTLIPSGGSVTGPAGSTVGWGYTLTNTTAEWIQPISLSSDPFQHGVPNPVFDFPAVAPNNSVTLDFSLTATASCGFPPCGLYELTWDSTAPLGFTNTGIFTVASDFFSAEPGTPGAADLGPAPDATAAYSATASLSPEPGTFALIGVTLACLGVVRRRRSCAYQGGASPKKRSCRQ